ncbi:hypothetical protein T265_06251 [Opisthorchis viverrini]|uniref:Reverse transcriptase domain-containing protein n=1 Tax=Opisthorchis viverrini TaxID=6198 RepID=A0A074ZH46_OPIVI|nr:hypothetical protein T265_06251 [Opisthorchis viverrini]KER26533.1 hypothetical protein T265_06251 [Opisthorchis viverrini]
MGRSVVRAPPMPLEFPCPGLGNLAVSQSSCFFRVAWQLRTEKLLQLNDSKKELHEQTGAIGKMVHEATATACCGCWLEREFTDRKVRGSNPTSASRIPLSRLGRPGSIPALVLPSGGMAARHRKGVAAGRFFIVYGVRYDGLKYGYRAKQGPDSSKVSELQEDLNSTEALFAATRSQGFGDVVRGRILAGNFFLLRTQRDRHLDAARRLWRLIKEDFEKAGSIVDLPLSIFRTQSGVRQGYPFSPFLLNLATDEIVRRMLEVLQNPEYAGDIVLIFVEEEKAQVFLDELTKVIPSFGMHFAPTKCKVMLVDMQSLNTPFTTQRKHRSCGAFYISWKLY